MNGMCYWGRDRTPYRRSVGQNCIDKSMSSLNIAGIGIRRCCISLYTNLGIFCNRAAGIEVALFNIDTDWILRVSECCIGVFSKVRLRLRLKENYQLPWEINVTNGRNTAFLWSHTWTGLVDTSTTPGLLAHISGERPRHWTRKHSWKLEWEPCRQHMKLKYHSKYRIRLDYGIFIRYLSLNYSNRYGISYY
jgi:hypothetical protein